VIHDSFSKMGSANIQFELPYCKIIHGRKAANSIASCLSKHIVYNRAAIGPQMPARNQETGKAEISTGPHLQLLFPLQQLHLRA
jgi:hypothetical protein